MNNQLPEIWKTWIVDIASDPNMDLDRLVRHLQVHVADHMPNAESHPERWVQWMAGTYNLLGILSAMTHSHPDHELGLSRLFQKFKQHPADHTPPPKGTLKLIRDLTHRK